MYVGGRQWHRQDLKIRGGTKLNIKKILKN